MSRERSLLERLADPKAVSHHTMHEDTNAAVRSVIMNLHSVLNSRQGHAEAQMDLGIPAPCEIANSFPEGIGRMQKAIAECVEKYEPRLASVNVAHIESDTDHLVLRFQVTARLKDSANNAYLSFDTLFDPAGGVTVSR